MTPEQVCAMSNEELDAVVAEKVMGWKRLDRIKCGWGDGPLVWGTNSDSSPTFQGFEPSSEIDHAWQVVAVMRRDGWYFQLSDEIETDEWHARFTTPSHPPGGPCRDVSATCKSETRAICEAALLAVTNKETPCSTD